jgi:thymidine phosphorylase
MQTKADARRLARAMVTLGNQCGVNTRAVLTDMNSPVGRAAGNWLEVKESVACLEPRNRVDGRVLENAVPSHARNRNCQNAEIPTANARSRLQGRDDLRELVLACAAHLLVQTRNARNFTAACQQAEDCLNSGAPRIKWDEMLIAQGADLGAFKRKLARDHTAPAVVELKAARSGFVSRCDARLIGEIIRDLGGGRLTKESVINYDVGVDRIAKPGEWVRAGAALARLHAVDRRQAVAATGRLREAFAISARKPPRSPLLAGLVDGLQRRGATVAGGAK